MGYRDYRAVNKYVSDDNNGTGMDKELEIIWKSIEACSVTPTVVAGSLFNPGARLSDMEYFQRELGLTLPKDVVESFLRHDGMPPENAYYCFWEGNFLSHKDSLKEKNERLHIAKEMSAEPNSSDYYPPDKVVGHVKPLIWSELWIPVLKKNKEPVCLDFDPAEGGDIGQVIEVDWEGSEVKVIARSYREFLKKVLETL